MDILDLEGISRFWGSGSVSDLEGISGFWIASGFNFWVDSGFLVLDLISGDVIFGESI